MTRSTTTTNDPLGYGFAVAGAVLFSTKGIFIKLAYGQGVSTEMLLSLRMLVALPVVLASMAVGILVYYLSSYLDFWASTSSAPNMSGWYCSPIPSSCCCLVSGFFGDAMLWRVVPTILVSYAGLLVIFG
ncbi:MAG: hypothetical protein MO852_08805 [Candidatus Devosia euplotis]|nr:hypothetical protein [Candidatus Devosia euplotis]